MSDLLKLIELLIKSKWWLVLILFFSFLTYIFSSEIKRLLDLKILNSDIVLNSINDDVIIETALNDLMIKTKADRAYIFRFHNGDIYYNGSHKSKMSCDYEVVNDGVSREAERLQDIPTALYSRWLKDVIEYKMFIDNVSEIDDIRTKQMLELQGINALSVVPYYRNGKIFALIGIDYINEIAPNNNQDKRRKINEMKRMCNEIGSLLK